MKNQTNNGIKNRKSLIEFRNKISVEVMNMGYFHTKNRGTFKTVKHLRWSLLQIAKNLILDALLSLNHACN